MGNDEGEILLTHVAKVVARNFDALCERLFAFADPDTGVIELIYVQSCTYSRKTNNHYLLVRLIGAFWVTDLGKKIILLFEDKVLGMVHQT